MRLSIRTRPLLADLCTIGDGFDTSQHRFPRLWAKSDRPVDRRGSLVSEQSSTLSLHDALRHGQHRCAEFD